MLKIYDLSISILFMQLFEIFLNNFHRVLHEGLRCVKSVRIRSYSGQYIPVFGLNTERYSVSLRVQSEHGKIRTRITPNTNTFHVVLFFSA